MAVFLYSLMLKNCYLKAAIRGQQLSPERRLVFIRAIHNFRKGGGL